MIFDLRIYTLRPGMLGPWLKMYEQYGHPTQVKHCCEPVFYATTEVGPMNQVVHVWKYASQADRERRRDALMQDPAFQEYMRRSAEMGAHAHQENRILKSVSFSPL